MTESVAIAEQSHWPQLQEINFTLGKSAEHHWLPEVPRANQSKGRQRITRLQGDGHITETSHAASQAERAGNDAACNGLAHGALPFASHALGAGSSAIAQGSVGHMPHQGSSCELASC
jgi:hypothetical protein